MPGAEVYTQKDNGEQDILLPSKILQLGSFQQRLP